MSQGRVHFTLRSLLLVLTASSVASALLAARVHRLRTLRRAVADVAEVGGVVVVRDTSYKVGRTVLSVTDWRDDDVVLAVDFVRCRLSDRSLKALEHFSDVTSVNLSRSTVREDDLSRLHAMPQLRALDLSDTTIGDRGVRQLSTSLTQLNLSHTKVSDASCDSLVHLSLLRQLSMSFNDITDAGAERLAALRRLEELDLSYTEVADRGARALSRLGSLRALSLAGCPGLSDRGLQVLIKNNCLRWIAIEGTQVTAAAIGDARLARPDLTIVCESNCREAKNEPKAENGSERFMGDHNVSRTQSGSERFMGKDE